MESLNRDFIHVEINVAAAGITAIIASVPGRRIEVWQVFLYNVAAQNLELRANARSLTGPLNAFPAASGVSLPYTGAPHFRLQSGEALNLITSGVTQVSGFVNYLLKD
jgi:hypothetical protein